jgi:hypothetical protein
VAAALDLHSRRIKFILAMSLAIGIGLNVWPFTFLDMRGSFYTANFWRCADCSGLMKGLRNGISIFLSSGYCVGTVVAMILSAILPEDVGVNMGRDGDFQEIEKSKDKLDEETKLGADKDLIEDVQKDLDEAEGTITREKDKGGDENKV